MKKSTRFETSKQTLLLFTLLFALLGFSQNSFAQLNKAKRAAKSGEHVKSLTLVSKGMAKKIKNSEAKLFVQEYPEAMAEIAKLKADLPGTEFGYDKLVVEAKKWVKMYKNLSKLPPQVAPKKGDPVNIEIVDYAPFLAECQQKACEEHYALILKYKDAATFAEREKAIEHVNIIYKLNDNKTFKDEKELALAIYLDEAEHCFTEGKDFEEREKSITYYTNAEKFGYAESWRPKIGDMYNEEATRLINDPKFDVKITSIPMYEEAEKYNIKYNAWRPSIAVVYTTEADRLLGDTDFRTQQKAIPLYQEAQKYDASKTEWKGKVAEIYYVEGNRIIASSTKLSEKEAGIEVLNKTTTYVPEYKDVKDISAGVYYDEAAKFEANPNFKNMRLAAANYGKAIEWNPDFRDASAKQKSCINKSYVVVLFVGPNGKCYDPTVDSPVIDVKYYEKYLGSNFRIKPYNGTVDLSNSDNFSELADKNYIVIRKAPKAEFDYQHSGPTVTRDEILQYWMMVEEYDAATNSWKTNSKETTKSTYNTAKLMGANALEQAKTTLEIREGTVTKTKESATLYATNTIEIWDLRGTPELLDTYAVKKKIDSKVSETEVYTGDSRIRPSNLKNSPVAIPTEAQMISSASSANLPLSRTLPKRSNTAVTPTAKNDNVQQVVDKLRRSVIYK